LVFAAVLGVDRRVGVGGGQHGAAREHDGILIEFVVGVREGIGHALRDRVILLAHRYGEHMTFAVVTLPAPAARDDLLEFLGKIIAAGERGRRVVVNEQPLAAAHGVGESLLVLRRPARIRTAVAGVLVIEEQDVIFRQVLRS